MVCCTIDSRDSTIYGCTNLAIPYHRSCFAKLPGGCRVGKVTEYISDSERSLTVFHSTHIHTLFCPYYSIP